VHARLDAAEVLVVNYAAELVAERATVVLLQGVVAELRAETLRAHALRVWRNWWSV
jgi:hypothetical protein